MTADDSKFDLSYLKKLVDECNNTYHCPVGKKPIDADYSTLTEEIEKYPKAPKFKVGDRGRINECKNSFRTFYTKNWSKEIFVIDSVLKINPWRYKIKDLNRESIIGSFYEKGVLLSKLQMSYYPEPDSHTRDKVKVILDMSNYATN